MLIINLNYINDRSKKINYEVELCGSWGRDAIARERGREDIVFSNSPIEAINKIYKRFLRYFKPQTYNELEKVTELFVLIYNTIRPHGSLKGLTPFKAYQNYQPVSYSGQIVDSKTERTSANKAMVCSNCK